MKIITKAWEYFKSWINVFLRGQVVKLALKKILSSSIGAVAGVQGWLVAFIVGELYDELAEPIVKLALREIGYHIEVVKGKTIVKKINKARQEGNHEDYRRNVDDLFNK